MNYTVANEIYEMMMNTSVVKQLIEKNKRLKKENKSLKNLINSLPEFRCKCSDNHTTKSKKPQSLSVAQKEPQGTKKREPLRKVIIKTESIKEEKENIKMTLENDGLEIIEGLCKQIEGFAKPLGGAKPRSSLDNPRRGLSADDSIIDLAEEEEEVEEEEEEVEVEADKDVVKMEIEEVEEEEDIVVEEEETEEETEEEEEEEEEAEEEVVEEAVKMVIEEVEVEEEESEVFEITIGKKTYYTNDETNGTIYAVGEDEDIGDEVGMFVNGKPKFTNTKS